MKKSKVEMKIVEALNWRYATKKFDPLKKISEHKIDVIKKSFNLTPSSFGLQPLRLVIISNQSLKDELVKNTMNQKQISTASHVLVICIETNIDKDFIVAHFEREKSRRETPDKIIAPYREFLIKYFNEKSTEFVQEWAKNQAYLALGNLLTVCAVEEIDSCPMEGFEPKKYDEVLNLKKEGLKSVLVLPIGYRAEDDMFSDFKKVRRSLEDTTIEM